MIAKIENHAMSVEIIKRETRHFRETPAVLLRNMTPNGPKLVMELQYNRYTREAKCK